MTDLIRTTRAQLGLTGHELGERLGVTAGAVSQMERSEREGRIQLDTLRRALRAMDRQLIVDQAVESPYSRYAPARVTDSVAEALADGDTAFALRLITQAAKMVAQHPDALTERELNARPSQLSDPRWEQFLRAMYEDALPEDRRPSWTKPQKLARRWYVSQFDSLRQRARETTPQRLRDLNIYIDERSLTRA
jgi:transcriptional regulator with XRE-family HTH domain